MTAAAPWSVKGIDPKAREVAKDLARRSGMTLGEWLNRMIIEGEGSGADASAADALGGAERCERQILALHRGGDDDAVDGLCGRHVVYDVGQDRDAGQTHQDLPGETGGAAAGLDDRQDLREPDVIPNCWG